MTNDEKLEVLVELRKEIMENSEFQDLDEAVKFLLPILRVLDKLFYEQDGLREKSLDYLSGHISIEDFEKEMK